MELNDLPSVCQLFVVELDLHLKSFNSQTLILVHGGQR